MVIGKRGSRTDPDGFPLALIDVSCCDRYWGGNVNILLVSFQDMIATVDEVFVVQKRAVDESCTTRREESTGEYFTAWLTNY
jgi:hypothetical protein